MNKLLKVLMILILSYTTACTSVSKNIEIMPDGTEKIIVGMADRGVFSPSEIRHYEFICTGKQEARKCLDANYNTTGQQQGVANEWGRALIHGASIVGSAFLAIEAASEIADGLSESGDNVNLDNSSKSKSKGGSAKSGSASLSGSYSKSSSESKSVSKTNRMKRNHD